VNTKLRILMVSELYEPDPAAGQRVAEAASALATQGHVVRVLARRRSGAETKSERNGVLVERLWSPVEPGSGLIRKVVAAVWFELFAFFRTLLSGQPLDVLVTVSTPPMGHVAGVALSRLKGVTHVFWCADVHPESLLAVGVLSPRRLPVRCLARLNRWAMGRCHTIIAVGRCMRDLLIARGAPPEKVVIVTMWQRDRLALAPNPVLVQRLRSELGLDGRFVVMYSGNLGRMHHFETIVAAAQRLTRDAGFTFLFAGSGPGLDQLRAQANTRGLDRIVIHPLFSEEMLREALALADVHVVTLRNSAAGVSVPGKLYGAMAAGRPVIFIGPEESEVARTIREEQCGFVVPANDPEPLVKLLCQLRADPATRELLGQRARAAFQTRYCQSRRCKEFSRAIERAVAESQPCGDERWKSKPGPADHPAQQNIEVF